MSQRDRLTASFAAHSSARGHATAPALESAAVHAASSTYVFEENLAAIVMTSPDGHVRACNPAFARLIGFKSTEQAIGIDLRDVYPPHALEARLVRVRIDGSVSDEQLELRRSDGSTVHVIARLVGRHDARGTLTAVTGYLVDDTPRKALETQIRHAMRMEAVGRLAGGMAHDFNNLLMIINGLSEVVLEQLPEDAPLRLEVVQILEAGRRGSTLASQMLSFSRKPVARASRFDVDEAISGIRPLIARLLGSPAALEVRHTPDAKPVTGDREQFEQVLINLAMNAHDAMPDGGRLTLDTCILPASAADAGPVRHPAGARVRLRVIDTGVGMSPETLTRIFEPFFTTKTKGKGTGLGLAQVHATVTENGGSIDVWSEPGAGTTFTITLPLASGADRQP